MLILGLNAFHGDSSACIIRDGQIVAAAEEERFRRIKHWAGFPSQAIQFCLDEAGADLGDVGHIAINQDNRANLADRLLFVARRVRSPKAILDRLKNRSQRQDIAGHLATAFPHSAFSGTVHGVEHHRAHLVSAAAVSGFERSCVASVDGFGDFASAQWGIADGTTLDIHNKVLFPHSLGAFYQALTQYLGFRNYGDEYKVMGLTAYGEPTYVSRLEDVVHLHADGRFTLNQAYFRHGREHIPYQWADGSPEVGIMFADALEGLLGPARQPGDALEQSHKDIAHSVQVIYEAALFNLLNALKARGDSTDLCLAGGCAMNSLANGKIRRNTGFERVYIQAAAGDAGGAIGAALDVWQQLGGDFSSSRMDHAYLGPGFSDAEIAEVVSRFSADFAERGCTVEVDGKIDDIFNKTATAISEGKVIGWFQGRMEWGPRALGNRSILGDPRRDDMKDILNLKIKRRESFRPFAPSIMREHVAAWFEEDDDVPFMMKVFGIRPEKRADIPAVVHADGTGRLQTVTEASNSRYYGLIRRFNEITGVPMLLNTSFNENEPIVSRPEEAIDCFLRTNMDVLVLGNTYIARPVGADHSQSETLTAS